MAKRSNDLYLHIRFHLVSDNTYDRQRRELYSALISRFGQMVALEHEDTDYGQTEREVVFRVQKPALLSESEFRDLFMDLRSIFDEFGRYLPSFTQGGDSVE